MTAARTVPLPEGSRSAVPGSGHTVRRGGAAGRRIGVLVLLAAFLVAGMSVPSWASFSDSATVSTTVATATVAPPTNPAARTRCTGNTASVALNWAASTSPRVSGYRIRLYLGNAFQDQVTVGATTTSWQGSADTYYVSNYVMTFSVWTLTEYGWTAESVRTARILC
jgi:predicted ribosomally synthesized peptide with SipW-like signal peptide